MDACIPTTSVEFTRNELYELAKDLSQRTHELDERTLVLGDRSREQRAALLTKILDAHRQLTVEDWCTPSPVTARRNALRRSNRQSRHVLRVA
jgi:hypothetical protein